MSRNSMKLSTSTLGCLKWGLPEVINKLVNYGYDGVDFRGLRGELSLWKLPEFSSNLSESATRIRDAGLTVSCISSGIHLTEQSSAKVAEYDDELKHTLAVCDKLDCRQIRIFGGALSSCGNATESERDSVLPRVAERLCNLAENAAKSSRSVKLLVETHDDFISSEHIGALLESANSNNVECCWDIKHTCWVARETPQATWKRLKPWITNTHWKDVQPVTGGGQNATQSAERIKDTGRLCPMGQGVLPLKETVNLLQTDGYNGWFTFEWEKLWHPHIEEPEISFPGFVNFMRALQQ